MPYLSNIECSHVHKSYEVQKGKGKTVIFIMTALQF